MMKMMKLMMKMMKLMMKMMKMMKLMMKSRLHHSSKGQGLTKPVITGKGKTARRRCNG